MEKLTEFEQLEGQTCTAVERDGESIVFTLLNGDKYRLHHNQDCCEDVYIEDICGELGDLVGAPILLAEEATNSESHPPGVERPEYTDDSFTWTFYKLATINGYVTIRWFGTSNGYYSESVDFRAVPR